MDGIASLPLFYDPGFLLDLAEALDLLVENLLWLVLGVLMGMFFGLIPGMGGSVALAIMLPFTLGMDTHQAFTFLSGALGATTFAGSITAILVSTPGTVPNAATLLDGYPLTQRGEADRAIGASALSSAAGAVVAISTFVALIPVIIEVALLFGPGNIFWLVLFAILIIPIIVGERVLLGIAIAFFGGLLSFIGRASQTGEYRFTFDNLYLYDGLQLIPVLIGIFAFAELIKLASSERQTISEGIAQHSSKFEGMRDVIKHKGLWFKSTLIGFFSGVLPGLGGSGATFLAYSYAIQSAEDKRSFGKGRIEGVIAAESANDAKDGGQLIPTLGLGVPGSASMAVFMGGLLMHGIFPSPRFLIEQLDLGLLIAFSFLFSNILTSVIGVLSARFITKVLEIPISRLLPLLTILAVSATYIVRNSMFDVFIAVVFGIFGAALMYYNISRVPFIVAFILAILLEDNYFQAVGINHGDPVEALFGDALSLLFIGLIVLALGSYALNLRVRLRDLYERVI